MSLPENVLSYNLTQLSNLNIIQNLLLQIQANINLIIQGAAGQTITINGGSLFALASQYYGDATLWTTIAKANGLVDPIISPGIARNLVIPDQTRNTGGIYQS